MKYDLDSLYDKLKKVNALIGPSINGINIHISKAISEEKLANYYLNQTTIKSPENGYIENFSTHVGDYYIAEKQQIPLIVNNTWWIEALVKENSLSAIKQGQDTLVALSSEPGRVYPGKVISIGQGVQTEGIKKINHLPEYKKQVSWFEPYQVYPVRIQITQQGEQKNLPLKVGSSASVIIFTNSSYFWKGCGYIVMWLNSLWFYI
jgi:multidrug resistance efflux pump